MNGFDSFSVGKHTVYHTNLIKSGFADPSLLRRAYSAVSQLKSFNHPFKEDLKLKHTPGIQYNLQYNFNKDISDLITFGEQKCLEIFGEVNNYTPGFYLSFPWVYWQDWSSEQTFWHTHTTSNLAVQGLDKPVKIPLDLTFVIYLNIPDDAADRGKIWFSATENVDHNNYDKIIREGDVSYIPKVGDLVIFPGSLPHFPELHQDKVARVVLASALHIKKKMTSI